MKAVGYIRVSGEASKDGESPDTQRNDILKHVEYEGWKFSRHYEDLGISGSAISARPAFQQMLKDAKANKFDVIIVSRLTRFARNLRELLNFLHEFEKYGIKFYSVREKLGTTDDYFGKFFIQIIGAIAELELSNIESTMKDGKKAKWSDKRCYIGKVPYGYIWDKENKQILVNEEEKEIYLRVVDMYLNLGMSYKDITIKLRDEGILSKTKAFHSANIGAMLKNPAYYGRHVCNQFICERKKDELGNIIGKRFIRTKKLKPESEWIIFDMPPFISKQIFDQIQEKINFNVCKGTRRVKETDLYWLRDVLRCGCCGGRVKMKNGTRRKDGTFPRYYSCYYASCGPKVLQSTGKTECPLPFIKAEEIETKVWNRIMMHLSLQKKSLVKMVDPEKYEKKLKNLKSKLTRLEKERQSILTKKDRFYDLFGEGGFNKNELSKKLNGCDVEIIEKDGLVSKTEQEIIDLEETQKNDTLYKDFMKNASETLKTLRKELFDLEPNDKKKVVEGMINGEGIKVNIGLDIKDRIWLLGPYRLRFNPTVLLELKSLGKLTFSDSYIRKHNNSHGLTQ